MTAVERFEVPSRVWRRPSIVTVFSCEPPRSVEASSERWLRKGCSSGRLRKFSCLDIASAPVAIFRGSISSDGETDCSGNETSSFRGAAWVLLRLPIFATGCSNDLKGVAAVSRAPRAARTHRPVASSLMVSARLAGLLSETGAMKFNTSRIQTWISFRLLESTSHGLSLGKRRQDCPPQWLSWCFLCVFSLSTSLRGRHQVVHQQILGTDASTCSKITSACSSGKETGWVCADSSVPAGLRRIQHGLPRARESSEMERYVNRGSKTTSSSSSNRVPKIQAFHPFFRPALKVGQSCSSCTGIAYQGQGSWQCGLTSPIILPIFPH